MLVSSWDGVCYIDAQYAFEVNNRALMSELRRRVIQADNESIDLAGRDATHHKIPVWKTHGK